MTAYPNDPGAPAVILYDYGRTFFLFPDVKSVNEFGEATSGFKTVFYHYFRIKIFDTTASCWVDVEIPLHHTELAREEVSKLHASTWNLENGKIIKSKLTEDRIVTGQVDKTRDIVKFTMPDIRKGSVYEVEYTVTSEFLYNLPTWPFQCTIPVIKSEYDLAIPEYYRYNLTQTGYIPVDTRCQTRLRKIMLTYQEKPQGLTNRVATHTRDVDYYETTCHYLAENVEAFPVGEYLTTAENYITKIEFELASANFPDKDEELSSNTWATINNILLRDKDFGMQLSETGFLKNDAAILMSDYPGTERRMNAALELIRQKMRWNGKYGKYVSSSLDTVYQQGKGNVADINLLLVGLLKESGISAAPVILSTRDNGFIDPSRASPGRINYVIACATTGDRKYLMDATDPYSGLNLLPPRCLNGQGMIVDEVTCGWIDLGGKLPSCTQKTYKLTLDKNGNFIGKNENIRTRYSAYNFRKEVKSCPDESEYIRIVEEQTPGLRIAGWNITNLDSLDLPVSEEYECVISGRCQKDGDRLLFAPLLTEALKDDPFKLEDRKYPVEFCYPSSEQYTFQISIPEGYAIESIPSPLQTDLPGRAAGYTFIVNINEGMITCTSNLQINKLLFQPAEYADLKRFFETIISRQTEKVVLKSK